jgi:hypothetical protein
MDEVTQEERREILKRWEAAEHRHESRVKVNTQDITHRKRRCNNLSTLTPTASRKLVTVREYLV